MAEVGDIDPTTWRPGPTAVPGLMGPSVNPDKTKQAWDWAAEKLNPPVEGEEGDDSEPEVQSASLKSAKAESEAPAEEKPKTTRKTRKKAGGSK